MEMEMRGREDIEKGEDITPPLPPLSFSLLHSLLLSHCSSCFSPLPPYPFPPTFSPLFPPSNSDSKILYCSPQCSAADSPLHLSSAEPHLLRLLPSFPYSADSSDLRAALRLLQSHPSTCSPSSSADRIAGLSTNRQKLTVLDVGEGDDDIAARIRDGARAMAAARRMRDGDGGGGEGELEEAMAAAALCAVLTNAVEVQDKSGRALGVAVYGRGFSWINHSCSPNACYRISLPSELETTSFYSNDGEETAMRIVPSCKETQIVGGVCSKNIDALLTKECGCLYGPRIIVRSIKRIKKGEEVTVAYTDLLQPKEISVVSSNSSSSNTDFYRDRATQMLTEYIDDAISDYLSISNPQSCCEKFEYILTRGFLDEQLECNNGTSLPTCTYWLHPLHYLSLNAYTTLASAYKTRANDMLALFSETNGNLCEAFEKSRISVAYSLLLAGATNHLYQFEPSLIASAANFWASAGESLLSFARSSIWSEFMPFSSLSSISKHDCLKCSLRNRYETGSIHSQVQYADFEHVSGKLHDCVTDHTRKVWNFLVHGCSYLRVFRDPLDFSSLVTAKYCCIRETHSNFSGNNGGSKSGIYENNSGLEQQGCTSRVRIHLFDLGVHCLLYGAYLASICFGQHSYLTCHIQNILDREEY